MEFEREERSFVRPIFEECPLPLRAPGRIVEQPSIVGSEARKGGQIVGTREHVDAVDLVERKPVDCPTKVAGVHSRRPRNSKALRGEDHPSRSLERECLDRGSSLRWPAGASS